jgi:hypothetical protein
MSKKTPLLMDTTYVCAPAVDALIAQLISSKGALVPVSALEETVISSVERIAPLISLAEVEKIAAAVVAADANKGWSAEHLVAQWVAMVAALKEKAQTPKRGRPANVTKKALERPADGLAEIIHSASSGDTGTAQSVADADTADTLVQNTAKENDDDSGSRWN